MIYTKIYQFLTFNLKKWGQNDPKSKSCKKIRINHARKSPYTNFLKMYTKTRTSIDFCKYCPDYMRKPDLKIVFCYISQLNFLRKLLKFHQYWSNFTKQSCVLMPINILHIFEFLKNYQFLCPFWALLGPKLIFLKIFPLLSDHPTIDIKEL